MTSSERETTVQKPTPRSVFWVQALGLLVGPALGLLAVFGLAQVYDLGTGWWFVGASALGFVAGGFVPRVVYTSFIAPTSLAVRGDRVTIDGRSFPRGENPAILVEEFEISGRRRQHPRFNVKWLPEMGEAEGEPIARWTSWLGRFFGKTGARERLVASRFHDRNLVRRFAEDLAKAAAVGMVWKSEDGSVQRREFEHLDTSLPERLADADLPDWPGEPLAASDQYTVERHDDGTVTIDWQPGRYPLYLTIPAVGAAGAGVGFFAGSESNDAGVLGGFAIGGAVVGALVPVWFRLAGRHRGTELKIGSAEIVIERRALGFLETTDRIATDRIEEIQVDRYSEQGSRRLVAIGDDLVEPLGPYYAQGGAGADPVRRAVLLGAAGVADRVGEDDAAPLDGDFEEEFDGTW